METKIYYVTFISKIAGNSIHAYDTKEQAEQVMNEVRKTFGNDIKMSLIEA